MRRLLLCVLLTSAGVAAAACGSESDVAQPTATAPSAAEIARERNEAVIEGASRASDAQAAGGERAIRRTLKRKLGMNNLQEFALNGSVKDVLDCYVKTGADAVNFSDQTENTLYSPSNPADLIFVQSSTGTPLVDCLKAVKTALGW